MRKKERAAAFLALLNQRYPAPATHLDAKNPWELLVATVLAAQCTDERVNKVTPKLFRRWPGPEQLAEAMQGELEEVVHSTGFYRNKAKNLITTAQMVTTLHGGEVPRTMAELVALPGLARKTANIVLWGGYGINEGLAVDTHVKRIAFRMGFTKSDNPVIVEKDLMPLFPREEWGDVNHRMVWFGRHVCDARKPLCYECEMLDFCPQNGVNDTKADSGNKKKKKAAGKE
ncbi:endonuclease III [Oleidesulfovibrio sp.]|uniref:endonuclease III n=1 Tax=Oleidesulfovibrio sp. TaxID=2909707 RepID=UPI003A850697